MAVELKERKIKISLQGMAIVEKRSLIN